MANLNQRKNSIESLLVNRLVSSDHSEIKEHITLFYNRLSTEQFSWQHKLDGFVFYSIDEAEATWLERPFEEIEVLEVVKGMTSDKAPGLDRFTMAFFQTYWDVIKDDVMRVFQDFHARDKFEKKP